MTCERCPAQGFTSLTDLVDHLQDDHAMTEIKARREADAVWKKNGLNSNGHVAIAAAFGEAPTHECPKCGTKIKCLWEAVARMEQQAASIKMVAAKTRNRMLGLSVGGAPRNNAEWTDEDAYNAYASGMSVRAIARLLHAGTPTIDKALARAKEKREVRA